MNKLSNALVSSRQLISYDRKKAHSQLVSGAVLIQECGIYLGISQLSISTAIILFQRFYCNHRIEDYDIRSIAPAAILVAAKLCPPTVSCSSIAKVFAYKDPGRNSTFPPDMELIYKDIDSIISSEIELLAGLGFDTHVVLPYDLALSYLGILGQKDIGQKVWNCINDAIISAPDLAVVHQPNTIAVACIWLVAAWNDTPVGDEKWWYVFDVSSEDLGHAMELILESRKRPSKINENAQM